MNKNQENNPSSEEGGVILAIILTLIFNLVISIGTGLLSMVKKIALYASVPIVAALTYLQILLQGKRA